jgi:hypothetical protein
MIAWWCNISSPTREFARDGPIKESPRQAPSLFPVLELYLPCLKTDRCTYLPASRTCRPPLQRGRPQIHLPLPFSDHPHPVLANTTVTSARITYSTFRSLASLFSAALSSAFGCCDPHTNCSVAHSNIPIYHPGLAPRIQLYACCKSITASAFSRAARLRVPKQSSRARSHPSGSRCATAPSSSTSRTPAGC